jgi:hypothetical protein
MKKVIFFILLTLALAVFSAETVATTPGWLDKILSFDFAKLFVVVSAFLSAIVAMCSYIAGMLNNPAWGTAAVWIGKIIGWLGKLVDFINSLKPNAMLKK